VTLLGVFAIVNYDCAIEEKSMATTITLINMKGGVGKSTLAVNLAWFLAAYQNWNKRVLLVDLDPQFNASQYMLGPQQYEQILRNGNPTVWDVFEQQTRTPHPPPGPFDVRRSLVNRVAYSTGGRVDLMPSRLELAFSLRTPFQQKETLLARTLKEIDGDYDVILIDCAPTESMLTTAAYLASNFVLVPVKPEYLSAIGLPLLVNSMNEFRSAFPDSELSLAGIVFNFSSDYSPEEFRAKQEVRQIAQQHQWHIFDSEIRYSRSYPRGAREGQPIFRTPRSQARQVQRFYHFTNELVQRTGL
jgi:chromosome partitioning protein